jgi:ADP-heptose:LPS heptosyltransferase
MKEPIILFPNAGGLGDMVCAEPVFRYAIEKVFTTSDSIVIASNYPEIFSHLQGNNVQVLTLDEINKQAESYQGKYLIRKTFIEKDTQVQGIVHQTMHPVDYTSLVCLQMMIPENCRQIKLSDPTQQEIVAVKAKFEKLDLKLEQTLLIHAGKTWKTRTIPADWWQEFITLMSGFHLCQIGKSEKDPHKPGSLKLSRVESLVDQLSLRELIVAISQAWGVITNDSLPVHLAGAFNNNLFVFSTFKEWENLKPYGHNKAVNLAKHSVFNPSWHRPTQIAARSDLLPSDIMSIKEVIKTPKEVARSVLTRVIL